jgi:hypothetical protein
VLRLASVFAAVATLAFAAEPTSAGKPTTPAAENAITTAKREFDAVKEARGAPPAVQPGLELPSAATPELRIGGGNAAAAVRTLPGKRDVRKKPANWLVDGVMKEPGQTSQTESELALEVGSPADDKESSEKPKLESGRSDRRKTGEEGNAKQSDPELNPLSRFMVGWMTAQDYALLRPGMGVGAVADTVARGDPSLPVLSSNPRGADFGGKDSESGVIGMNYKSGAPAAPRENPFLQSLVLPAQPSGPAMLPPAPAGTPRAFVPPAEPPSARPVTPDFARPSDDAKYFKQLKRF